MSGPPPRALRAGPEALLFEVDSLGQARALYAALCAWRDAREPAALRELVPAARSVLAISEPGAAGAACLAQLAAHAATWRPEQAPPPAGALVELPVRYDGEDLGEVAERVGLAVAEFVRQHSGAEYSVAFCGFAPGFAYLCGLPPQLQVPRLAAPRQRVPAGAVALAGEFAGVYPRASPGGWRLIGHTDACLWNGRRTPPALLVPGQRVRFRPLSC